MVQDKPRCRCALESKTVYGNKGTGTCFLLIFILPWQKNVHVHNSEGHRKYLKLMEKIPEDAEATVVLVGKRQHM